jgi:hypothetical protein
LRSFLLRGIFAERERDIEPGEMSYCAELRGLSGRQQKTDNSGGYHFIATAFRVEDLQLWRPQGISEGRNFVMVCDIITNTLGQIRMCT